MTEISHSETTRTSAADVWAWYADVTRWPRFDGGVRSVQLSGPFASGTKGSVVLPNGRKVPIRLRDVHEGMSFTDVQRLRGVTVTTQHRLDPDGASTRITHTVSLSGFFGRLFPRLTTIPVRSSLPASVARLAVLASRDTTRSDLPLA
ncbi:MAG TPA: SRPBCC family protein [Mycobacteriales bacterium]